MAFGILLGFGFLEDHFDINDRRWVTHQQNWLVAFWGIFLTVAAASWFLGPKTLGLDVKLHILAVCFAVAAPLFTGFFLWPLAALLALYQFRSDQARGGTHRNTLFKRYLSNGKLLPTRCRP
jgi:hypothetical protein